VISVMIVVAIAVGILVALHQLNSASSGSPMARWGETGDGPRQFRGPTAITTDRAGNVYVVDRGNSRVQELTADGQFVRSFPTVSRPTSDAVGPKGTVDVTEFAANQIERFSPDGLTIIPFGTKGSGPAQFRGPAGIATDGTGAIYISDIGNHRIQKFTSSGHFLMSFGDEVQLKQPTGLAIASDSIYVSDQNANQIVKFSTEGQVQTRWGGYGTAHGQFERPTSLAVDASGNVYVADSFNNRIQKFSPSGQFLAELTGGFGEPSGVAVDRQGNIYVTDFRHDAVYKYAPLTS
jgi:sugar lactone lactonase YvrE